MDTVELVEVIKTTLSRRGDGKTDPIRVVTEYWSTSGEKLAEVDPFPQVQPSVNAASSISLGSERK